jgi:hypothetical protein
VNHTVTTGALIGTAAGLFGTCCPPLFVMTSPEFRAKDEQEYNAGRIRLGESVATAVLIVIGLAIWNETGDVFHFLAAAGVAALFVSSYEFMISNHRLIVG